MHSQDVNGTALHEIIDLKHWSPHFRLDRLTLPTINQWKGILREQMLKF